MPVKGFVWGWKEAPSQGPWSVEEPGWRDRQCSPGREAPSWSAPDSRSGFFGSRGHGVEVLSRAASFTGPGYVRLPSWLSAAPEPEPGGVRGTPPSVAWLPQPCQSPEGGTSHTRKSMITDNVNEVCIGSRPFQV